MAEIELVLKVDGKARRAIILKPKKFRTGSIGYFATMKVDIDGDGVNHQGNFQLVKIGSARDTMSDRNSASTS